MTTPANFPRWFHLIIMYPVILCLTITAAHRSESAHRFKLKPYHYTSPSPPAFTLPELRVSDQQPPPPATHINPRRGVPPEPPPPQSPSSPPLAPEPSPPQSPSSPPLAPEPPPPQSPSSPPPPDSTTPPETDIPSTSTLSGSLKSRPKTRLAPPSPPDSNRNFINPRPPAFVPKSPPPPSRSPPPRADVFYRPPSH